MTRKSLLSKLSTIFVFSSLVLGIISCGENSGLGSSIDTKSPTLSIEYPPSGAAIRDKFILAGNCSDDKEITSVIVTVKRLDSDIKFDTLSYKASVNALAGTWQITLNEKDETNPSYYNGWKLPDGKYEVGVTAYDNAGNNSGASSRSFEIDNTPPLFIISNPGVVKGENKDPSAYGSVFTIEGTISDNHTISMMDVEIYDEDGNCLSHETYNGEDINCFREEEIPTAGGTSVQIAQYVENEAANRYSQLHPDKTGTVNYYAKINLYDATQVYQNPPKASKDAARTAEELKEDSVGNVSSKFYLYDDVYATLMSKKNGGKGLSAAALKDIVSGIDSSDDAKDTLATLNKKEKDSSKEENQLYFSLNPEANPTYNISGYDFDFTGEGIIQSASSGNTINVTVSAGLDNVKVNPATVKLWMKEFDAAPTKEELDTAIPKLVGDVKAMEREELEAGEIDWTLIRDNSSYAGSSVSVQTIAVPLPAEGIDLNKYYILVVTGQDVDKVDFKQNTVFGFIGNVSGIAPTIEITSPENGTFVKAEDFAFEGTAFVNNSQLKVETLQTTITATNGAVAVGNENGYTVERQFDEEAKEWTGGEALTITADGTGWKWTLTPSKIEGFLEDTKDATKYTLSIKGISSSGHDVTMSSMVQLDITPPVVSINTITPIVDGKDFDGSNNVYINGTVRIMGTIVEQNLKEVTYDILAKSEYDSEFVSILGLMEQASAGSEVLYDGKLEKSNSVDVNFPTNYLTQYYATKTGNPDCKIAIKVILTAVDEVGNKGSYDSTIYNKTIDCPKGRDFIIYQETDRPKITLDNAFTEYEDNGVTKSLLWKESDDLEHNNSYNINTDHNLFGTVSNNRLQVSASDDDALSAIRISVFAYKDDKDELVGGGSSFFSKTTGTYKCALPDEEGVYKVKVEAFDSKILPTDLNDSSTSFGYKSTDEFYIAISSGAPNIEISKPYAGSYQSGTVDIAGSVTKKEWIKSVKGVLNQNGELLESIVVSDPAFASQEATAWNSSVTLPTNASGNYSLVYTVTDRFGQKNSVERSFMVDIYPPKFKIEEPDSENRNVFTKDGIYTVKGSISDGEGTSGIKGFYFSLAAQNAPNDTYSLFKADGSLKDGWTPASVIPKGEGQYSWTANIDLTGIPSIDGTAGNTIYFAALDNAENISLVSENADSSSLTITRDTVSPTTSLLGSGLKKPADKVSNAEKEASSSFDEIGNLILDDEAELEEGITYYATADSYSLTGSVIEASGIAIVKIDGNEVSLTDNKWTFTGENADGTYIHEILVTDKAENSSSRKITVIRDKTNPLLSSSTALTSNATITEANSSYYKDGDKYYLTLSGRWSDATTGTHTLQYSIYPSSDNGEWGWSPWRTVEGVTKSSAESSWSVPVELTEGFGIGDGVGIKERAIDAAGNVYESEAVTGLTLDFSAPTIKKNSGDIPTYLTAGKTLSVEGEYADSFAIDDLICLAKLNGTEVASGSKGFTFTKADAEATPVTGTYSLVKSGSFVISLEPESDGSSEGEWTFELTVKDKAGRETKLNALSTVVDTQKPVWGSVKVNNADYAEGTWYKSVTMPFAGTITESGSGIDVIKYSIIKAGESDEPTYSQSFSTSGRENGIESFSSNLGEFTTILSGTTVKPSKVYMVAFDKAGNESEPKVFEIRIDTLSPTVECEQNGTILSNGKAAIAFNGNASDNASGIESLIIEVANGTEVIKTISVQKESIGANGSWTASLPSTDFANNSTYTVRAKAEDKAGNSITSQLFKVKVDSQAPTFSLADGTKTEVYTKDSVHTVKGSISDGENTSGIKGMYYSLEPQTAADGTYSLFNSDGSLKEGWEQAAVTSTRTTGSYTWAANIDLSEITPANGTVTKTVYFAVCDEAGNISVISENAASESLKITPDTVVPATNLLGSGLKKPADRVSDEEKTGHASSLDEIGNLSLTANSELSEDITYYATGDSYNLSGKITEESNRYTVTIDGSAVTPSAEGWSWTPQSGDGTHSHTIVVTDEAGNSVSRRVSVVKDTVTPVFTVSNDTTDTQALDIDKVITEKNDNYSSETVEGKVQHYYLLSGKWSDATSGTKKLEYRTNPSYENGIPVDKWSEWKPVDAPASTAETTWSIKVPLTEGKGFGEGIALQGRAIDAAGNILEHQGHSGLTLDFSAPTIQMTSDDLPTYLTADETLSIEGTYEDSFAVDDLICIAKLNGVVVESGSKGFTFSKNDNTPINVTSTYSLVKSGSFDISLVPENDGSSEGQWTFELTVKDKAGRTTKLNALSTLVDTQKPVWKADSLLVNKAEYNGEGENHSWYKASSLPFAGSYTESGSGIDHIEYTITKADGTSENGTFASSKDKNESGAFTGTESFSVNLGEFIPKRGYDGAIPNTVKFVAVDKAGNRSDEASVKIYIDSEPPALESNVTGSKFSNKKLPIAVTGSSSDDSSGVKSVKLNVTLENNTASLYEVTATPGADGAWSTEISSDFLKDLENKIYTVKATVEDNAGNATTTTIFRIDVDDANPVITNLSMTNTSKKYSVSKSETEETYFVHNNDGNKFSIYGSVKDAKSGIEKIELFEGELAVEAITGETPRRASVDSLPISDLDFSGKTGSGKYTLVATDNAGNTESRTLVVNFDNEGPKGLHAIDSKNKDIFFRIGDSDSDEEEITKGEGGLWDDELDLDVGGKYSPESYSKSQTVRVRGAINDSGSGVAMIYYKVINSATAIKQDVENELSAAAEAFLANYETDNNGYFRADKAENKRVTYTPYAGNKVYDSNGDLVVISNENSIFKGFVAGDAVLEGSSKRYATISTNFDNSFTGFDDGYNYLFLVTVDKVGNAALDTVQIVQNDKKVPYNNFSLNVDTKAPTLASDIKTTKLTNCASDFDVTGTFDDNASGVKKIDITIINDATKAEVKTISINKDSTGWSESGKAWQATIPATDTSVFPESATETFSVTATITDNAGNAASSKIFNIQIDKEAPELQNTSLAASSATYKVHRPNEAENSYFVNPSDGTFTIAGVAKDDYGVKEVSLSITGENGKSYSSTVETSGLYTFSGISLQDWTGTATATITVTDQAGNTYIPATSEEAAKNEKSRVGLTITFDTTVPVLSESDFKISDRELKTGENEKNWFKMATLPFSGKYTEAGSGIDHIEYTITKADETTESGTFASSKDKNANEEYTGTESFRANLGEFVTKLGDDGEPAANTVTLIAVDKVGNKSTSKVVQLYIDSEVPGANRDSSETIYANTSAKFDISGKATDNAAGIESVVLKLNGKEIKSGATTYGTLELGEQTTVDGKLTRTWTVTNVDASAIFAKTVDEQGKVTDYADDDSYSLYAVVTDNAGNSQSVNIGNIIFDKTAPKVTLTPPSDADTTTSDREINGTISLKGTITDENSLPEIAIEEIEYATTNTETTVWKKLTKYEPAVAADPENHIEAKDEVKGIRLSGNYTFSVTDLDTTDTSQFNDNTVYYIRAVAKDLAGNEGRSSVVPVKVSQDSDRPIVKISNLIDLGTDSNPRFVLKYGTMSQLTGRISDDDVDSESLAVVKEFYMTEYAVTAQKDKNTDGSLKLDGSGNQVYKIEENNVPTEEEKLVQKLDEGGNPVTDASGNPVMVAEKDEDGNSVTQTVYKPRTAVNLVDYTATTGEFTFKPSTDTAAGGNIDGVKNFYICVIDNAGKIFYTTYSTEGDVYLNIPKINVGGSLVGNEIASKKFNYTSDSTSPTVTAMRGLAYKIGQDGLTPNGGDETGADGKTTKTKYEDIGPGYKIGGLEKDAVRFQIEAYDESGIDIIELQISGNDINGNAITKTLKSSVQDDTDSLEYGTKKNDKGETVEDKKTRVWTTDYVGFSEYATGNISIKVTPYDKLGLIGNGNTTFVVDNTGPDISITTPENGDEKTGDVLFGGTAIDEYVSTSNIQWLIPTKTDVENAKKAAQDYKDYIDTYYAEHPDEKPSVAEINRIAERKRLDYLKNLVVIAAEESSTTEGGSTTGDSSSGDSSTSSGESSSSGDSSTSSGESSSSGSSDSSSSGTENPALGQSRWNGGIASLVNGKTASAWQFNFDGGYDSKESYDSEYIFKSGNPKLERYDSELFALNTNDFASTGIYKLPIFFMATDELGNFSIKEDFVVLHNPDGDKPVLKFSYPTVSDYNDDDKSYLTVGGAISLTGGAEIPSNTSSVRAVYIQIADDEGLFTTDSDDSDKTKAENYGFTVVDAYDVIKSVAEKAYSRTATAGNSAYVTDDIAKTHGFASREEFNAWWGIKVTGTTSWRIQLNSKGELNPAGNLTTNNIKVRACGINALGKMGAWTQENNLIAIHIDNDLPTATAVVNQYADGAINKDNIKADKVVGSVVDNVVYKLPDFTASQNYEADMFLRQQWYLVLDILDDSGIKSISVTDGTNDVTHYKTKWEVKDDSGKVVKSGYKIFVPVDKTKTAVSYTIEAVENGDNAKTSRFKYSFKIDNAAPTLAEIQDSNNKVALSTSKSNTITNSNYVYALSGVSEDDGSGVERVAFYYMRREKITKESLANGEFVLDPIILAEKDSNNQYYEGNLAIGDNGLTAIPIDGLSKEGEDHAVTDEWLYGKSVTGDVKLNGEVYDKFETTSDLGDHVRVGGLVKINGVFRLIKTKSNDGKSVTFEPSATEKGTNITALFPVAQVIDSNNSPKDNTKGSDNKFTFDSGKDDGDYMPESFTKAGTKWTWDATIHSDNLPDGPATLVILAFDKAGNVSGKRYPVNVANNAPRLAKLHLATDLNGDTKYGDSEFVTYDILTAAGKEQSEYDLVTSALGGTSFIAKDTLGVVPEFTGGNGDISMVFLRDDYGKVDVTNVTGLTSDQIAEIKDGKKYSYKYKTDSHTENEGETPTTVDEYGYRPVCYVSSDVGTSIDSLSSTTAYHASNQKFNGDRGDKTSGSRWIYSLSNVQLTGNDNPAESDDGKNKQISFTFWDSTDECTKGLDSQNCYVRLTDLEVDVTDGEAPKVNIEPFKWEGTGFKKMTVDGTTGHVPNNNLYYNYEKKKDGTVVYDTDGTVVYDTATVLGHIEIEGDLPSSTFADDSGEFDRDPKVSGKIVVRGTTYDDVRLDSIWVSFDDFVIEGYKKDQAVKIKGTGTVTTETTTTTGNATGAGTYSYTADRGGDGKTYYLAAWFNKTTEEWTVATGNEYWKFNIVTDVNSKLPDSNGEDKAFFDQRGHRVAWELYLDTAKLTNVAGLDKSVRVMAVDSRGTLPSSTTNATATDEQKEDGKAYAATNKPTYKMDVVPYITAIHTRDSTYSGLKDNNIRSASGKYSILKKSSNSENVITVEGFNFSTNNGQLAAKIAVNSPNSTSSSPYGTALASTTTTAATGTHVLGLTITKGSDTSSATITNNGISKSGYLEIFSNGVRTLNNLNNNNAHGSFAFTGEVVSENTTPSVNDYKNMPNRVNEADFYTTKNVTLTDDRYLRVFDMKDTGIKNGYYPVMMMNGNNPVFGYVDLNGMNNAVSTFTCFAANKPQYMVQRAEFSSTTGRTSDIEYLIGGMTWDQMAMSRDSKGKYMHVSVFNQNDSSMSFVYDNYAEKTQYKIYGYDDYTFYDGWGGGSRWNNWVTYVDDESTTNGGLTKASSANNNAINLEGIGYGGSNLVGRYQGMKLKTRGDSTTTAGAINYLAYYDDNTADSSIIFRTFKVRTGNTSLGNAMTGKLSSNLTEGDTTGRITAASNATKYLDLGVTSDGHAVIVYYDKNGNLRLVHSDEPVDGAITGTTFSATAVQFTPYIGQYVSMAIDSSNHIHIAAFDANKSTLRYIYLDSYSDIKPDEYIVDASTSVGKWTQIKIHPTSGKPYIAYYNNAEDGQKESIKLAYLSAAARADGYDANGYATGSWEYLTVPSLSPAQGGDAKFQSVCLDFDSANKPVVGYLGTNLEFGKWLDE